jgi:hypothetical protein
MGKPFGGRAIPQKGAIIGAGVRWVKAVIPLANQGVWRLKVHHNLIVSRWTGGEARAKQ